MYVVCAPLCKCFLWVTARAYVFDSVKVGLYVCVCVCVSKFVCVCVCVRVCV